MEAQNQEMSIHRAALLAVLLCLLVYVDGKGLYLINSTTEVNVPPEAAPVFFFSLRGTWENSECRSPFVYVKKDWGNAFTNLGVILATRVEDTHYFVVQIDLSDNPEYIDSDSDSILSCDQFKYFWLVLENETFRFGLGNDITKNEVWRSVQLPLLTSVSRIKVKPRFDQIEPFSVLVPPFSLPSITGLNIEQTWSNQELLKLMDFDYNGTTCVDIVSPVGKRWTLNIRLRLLAGFYSTDTMTVTVEGDFLMCEDPTSMFVSVLESYKMVQGKQGGSSYK